MAPSLDQLVEAWRRSPDERATIALCDRLGGTDEPRLVEEIGKTAATRHGSNPNVLMAVGRMYLGASRLGDAQGLLVAAGKMAPRNGEVYRWLGEILLRRGDAERALKVLDRAIDLGRTDGETELWRERAEKYTALQKRAGAQAVAAETARVFARPTGRSVIPRPPSASDAEVTTVVTRDMLVSESDLTYGENEPGSRSDIAVAPSRPSAEPKAPAARRTATLVMQYGAEAPPPQDRRPKPAPAAGAPPRALAPPPAAGRPITIPPPAPLPSRQPQRGRAVASMDATVEEPRAAMSPPPPSYGASYAGGLQRSAGLFPDLAKSTPHAGSYRPPRGSVPPPKALYGGGRSSPPAPVSLSSHGAALPSFELARDAWSPGEPDTPPQAHEVLNALAVTGIFEPSGGAMPTWDTPPKTRHRFVFRLVLLTCVLTGGGIGIHSYVRDVRGKQAEEARAIDNEVDAMLHTGRVKDLPNVETRLSRSFDLEPNNARTAMLWVRDRVLRAILSETESQGIDSAIGRARQLDIPEEELAFARIGSFLAQGDTAGGAALLPQWDGRAKKDPYFQLLAGAALERAGDLRAVERYQLAVSLDPELIVARVLLARAVTLEGDPAKGLELAKDIRSKWTDRPEGAALIALAWARDPYRGTSPMEAEQTKSRRSELPLALQAIPSAVEALEAMQRNADAEAKAAVNRALASANTPGLATWLGSIALWLGDDEMARRAALQAVSYSAIYPQARVLAARVALAGGRLDEALKAVSELDVGSPDVAIVRAAVAFERQDLGALSLALEALSPEVRGRPELAALARAAEVLRGDVAIDGVKLKKLASPEIAWGDLVAVDAALETGNLTLAKELIDKFGPARDRPPRALRVARLFRYLERPREADEPSKIALAGLGSPVAVVERIMVLLALDKTDEARGVVVKNAPQLGAMASWLLAYVDADGPHAAEARAKAALLEVPSARSPLGYRLLVALALADLGDKRRGPDLLRSIAQTVPRNPDLFFASRAMKAH